MSAIDDLIKHHEEMHHNPNVSIIHGFGDSNARAELAQLRAKAAEYDRIADNEHCPLCTWRGPVELDNGVCPQCGVDWPKSYREHRDAMTVARERIAAQARRLEETQHERDMAVIACRAVMGDLWKDLHFDVIEMVMSVIKSDDARSATAPAPQEQTK